MGLELSNRSITISVLAVLTAAAAVQRALGYTWRNVLESVGQRKDK